MMRELEIYSCFEIHKPEIPQIHDMFCKFQSMTPRKML